PAIVVLEDLPGRAPAERHAECTDLAESHSVPPAGAVETDLFDLSGGCSLGIDRKRRAEEKSFRKCASDLVLRIQGDGDRLVMLITPRYREACKPPGGFPRSRKNIRNAYHPSHMKLLVENCEEL